MKYYNNKIDYDLNPFDYEIVQCKCEDSENLYFETMGSKRGWTDSQYDDLKNANEYVFKTEKDCKRGLIKHIYEKLFKS